MKSGIEACYLKPCTYLIVNLALGRVTDGAFHFWDATDDFSATNMDLLFETDRLYLHKATGFFGAVPMSITGADHSMYSITFIHFISLAYRCTGLRPVVPGWVPCNSVSTGNSAMILR